MPRTSRQEKERYQTKRHSSLVMKRSSERSCSAFGVVDALQKYSGGKSPNEVDTVTKAHREYDPRMIEILPREVGGTLHKASTRDYIPTGVWQLPKRLID